MTKLSGTSGQPFAGIAASIGARGTSRLDKSSAVAMPAGKSFHDVIHKVSDRATPAPNQQPGDDTVKAPPLRSRLAQPAERDEPTRERVDHGEDKAPARHEVSELPSKAEIQGRIDLPTIAIAGQELAAVPAVKPQAAPVADDRKTAPPQIERSARGRELPATSAAKALMADIAEPEARPSHPSTTAPQAATLPQGNAPAPRTISGASGLEAVTARIERAVKSSARETLPEATKVTVVQQETHLPPVAQFTASQQVAKAVVAELEGSAAPPASAASNLALSQDNAPDQPLKILTISLEPPALGNVTVRLRLVGAAVSVHLAADRKDTSQMLDQQRDSIRELMQSAGYVADVAPVRHGALDGFQAGAGQAQPSLSGHQPAPNGQGTANSFSAPSDQSQSGAKQPRDERQADQETRHEQDVAPQTRRGPVYL
ncbi:flagellar hook-length control protein FliK [Bradyrhizobium sp. WSM 1704]|uniref:flagellar hook-length control protein FliK n=1 Tax=Bradyrhizobium semiaridum TaxID=2821404 RepID=UPI001CE2AA9E|nr:flagellar hook-length control protein FliK [Bradyrhizobium semiaridum]MCA6123797.1 flagellar hook-length control protein FliK [Bradyrhizobium semiaridum]